MAADVVEGAQLAIGAVGDDDRLVEDRDRHEVPHPRQVLGAGDELPGAAEDALPLQLQHGCVKVVARRQRGGAAERRARDGRGHARECTEATMRGQEERRRPRRRSVKPRRLPMRGPKCYKCAPTERMEPMPPPSGVPYEETDSVNNVRRFAILPVAMLVLAACQADEGSGSPGASEPAGSGAAGGGVCDDALRRRPSRPHLRGRRDPGLDRSRVSAPVIPQRGDRRVRGLRHRHCHGDCRAAGRRGRVHRSLVRRGRGRRMGRPLGHERRLGHGDHRARRGARLHAAVLLHPCPDGGARGLGHPEPRRPRRAGGVRG